MALCAFANAAGVAGWLLWVGPGCNGVASLVGVLCADGVCAEGWPGAGWFGGG